MAAARKSERNMQASLTAIPVFNEVRYVDEVLREVRRYCDSILVVDDGSTDGTSEVLGKYSGIEVIRHHGNLGYGQSLIDAFNFARRRKFDWLITLDCDHQHQPSHIPRFRREIERGDSDIISGSRYLKSPNGQKKPAPRDRVAINRKITGILNRRLGTKLTDSFCGFKAYRVEAVCRLNLTEKGYGLPLQLWIRAIRAQLRIHEIAVPLIYYDLKRNFGGVLEAPDVRLNYYMDVIERELGHDIREGAAESFCS